MSTTPLTQEIAAAADELAAGGLVAFPTETVYGLGARADDDAAVARIFDAKGRPHEHPLIVHVAGVAAAEDFAHSLSRDARTLMQACWPGPLTLIVQRRPGRAAAAAGGQDSIGLRMPAHPVALALLHAAAQRGVAGVAAPSANRFGRVSPTTAAHVRDEFGPALTVLDGGACDVGIESTIVDCTRAQPVLLRPGVLSRTAIAALLGRELQERDAASPRASGTLEAHYAPRAKLRLFDAAALASALTSALASAGPVPGAFAMGVAVYSRSPAAAAARTAGHVRLHRTMPDNAAAAAHELFAVLRELDAAGVSEIWVQEPPDSPEWEGVRDRLKRAAAA